MSFRLTAARSAVFLLLATAAACGGGDGPSLPPAEPITGPGDYAFFFRSGGHTRRYEVHVPPQWDGARRLPLVLAFHGVPGSPPGMRAIGGLDALADQRGFVVAYAQAATTGDWDLDCGGCTTADQQDVDDVRYVREVIGRLAAEAKVETGRVYAVGFSQGALLVHRLACAAPDAIRAFASVGATMLVPAAQQCAAVAGGAPILLVHGSADTEFPAGGRTTGTVSALSIDATVQAWVTKNGCPAAPAVSDVPDTQADGTTTRIERYTGCSAGAEVVLYRVAGGGHTWPGSAADFGPAPKSRDFSASAEILTFFER